MGRPLAAMVLAAVLALGATTGCERLLWPVKTDKQVEAAIVAGDWQKVADLAKAWHERDPANPVPAELTCEAWYRLGESQKGYVECRAMRTRTDSSSEDPRAAEGFADHMTHTYPDIAQAWQVAVVVLHRTQDGQRMVRYGEKAVALAPGDPSSWLSLGYGHQYAGQPDKAIDDYNKALGLDPKFMRAWYARATVYGDKGDWDHAIEDAGRAIASLKQEFSALYLARAEAYHYKRDLPHALADYDKTIEIDPEDGMAFYCRAGVYELQGRNDLALRDLNRTREIWPWWKDALEARANLEETMGLKDEEMTDLKELAGRIPHPTTARDWEQLGMAHARMDERKQAISDLTRAIRLNPRSQSAYEWRGAAHARLQEYDDAVADLTKAIEMNPYDAYAYGTRGNALTYRGDFAKAIEDYNRSIQLDPKDYHTYGGRSAAYTMLSQSAAADKDREAAKKLGGEAATTWTQQCVDWARYCEELRGNAGGPKSRTDETQSGQQ